MKYYFFKTLADKGRNRLRPLSGQTFPDGEEIDPTFNVQSDKVIRAMYPLGTIFCSDRLERCAGYYMSGNIYPIYMESSEYKAPSHIPPKEMNDAYTEFISGSAPTDEGSSIKEDVHDVKLPKMTTLSRMQKSEKFAVPLINKEGFYVSPDNWYLLLRNITNQVNTMMIGPTGTGKTELVMLACKKLGIPCHVYDMGSMHDPIAGLLGVHRLKKGGESVFDYAKFVHDISEPGVILLDELSRAPVTTNNILFPCLDSRRELPVEIAGGNDMRTVKVHDDCCFIATANVGSEYTGTMSMDRALVCRFFPIELDYMPQAAEKVVLVKRCMIPIDIAGKIVTLVNKVRSLYLKQELSCSLSTREALMAAELVADGWSVLSAMELVFLPLFEGTKLEGERGIVAKMILSM